MKNKKTWAVKGKDRNILFSSKKNAKRFVDYIYHNPNAEIVSTEDKGTDQVDLYLEGPFIYHTTFIVPDKQETVFVGYSMDLSDQRDIVFEIEKGMFIVVTRAYGYQQAININGVTLVGAIKHGPFNGEYDRPGYVKCYVEKIPWDELPESYCR